MEGHPNCDCHKCTAVFAQRAADKLWLSLLPGLVRNFGLPSNNVLTFCFGDAENFSGQLAGSQKECQQLREEVAFLLRALTQQYKDAFTKFKEELNKE